MNLQHIGAVLRTYPRRAGELPDVVSTRSPVARAELQCSQGHRAQAGALRLAVGLVGKWPLPPPNSVPEIDISQVEQDNTLCIAMSFRIRGTRLRSLQLQV